MWCVHRNDVGSPLLLATTLSHHDFVVAQVDAQLVSAKSCQSGSCGFPNCSLRGECCAAPANCQPRIRCGVLHGHAKTFCKQLDIPMNSCLHNGDTASFPLVRWSAVCNALCTRLQMLSSRVGALHFRDPPVSQILLDSLETIPKTRRCRARWTTFGLVDYWHESSSTTQKPFRIGGQTRRRFQ